MPQDHTGLNLVEILCETLETWELSSENFMCLTTDSGTNILSAAQQLGWTRLLCFGHSLHNAVNGSIKDDSRMSRATACVERLYALFPMGGKRYLAKFQLEHGLPQYSLVTDCWGSQQKMISRILEREAANRHIFGLAYHRGRISRYKNGTRPTLRLYSYSVRRRVSSVKPLLYHLTSEICLQGEEDTQLTKDIKKGVKTYMEQKYDDPQLVNS